MRELPPGRIEVSKEFGFNINDEYQVTPRPRWGFGRAAHPLLQALLEKGRAEYEHVLDRVEQHRELLHEINYEPSPRDPAAPFWNNIWFTAIDAAVLVNYLL